MDVALYIFAGVCVIAVVALCVALCFLANNSPRCHEPADRQSQTQADVLEHERIKAAAPLRIAPETCESNEDFPRPGA